jgi:hypothetical protein
VWPIAGGKQCGGKYRIECWCLRIGTSNCGWPAEEFEMGRGRQLFSQYSVGAVQGGGLGAGRMESGVGREEKLVKMVADAAKVVDGKGEKEYAFSIEFGHDIGVRINEFCSSAGMVCLG